jgi:SNF2 family DNA or RNA helicase
LSIKAGDHVLTELYREKGLGKVLGIQHFLDCSYYEVFFYNTNEVLTINSKDVQFVQSPYQKLSLGKYDSFSSFILRFIKNDINMTNSKKGVMSAGNFRITPLPHQVLAVDFVLNHTDKRCLIADEVGLGKTIEAAMIFEELKLRGQAKRVLIVTPSGLTQQWKEEMRQKFNEEFVIVDRNMHQSLREIHGRETNVWKCYDNVITSIDFVKPKVIKEGLDNKVLVNREEHNKYVSNMLVKADWDVVIFDEAHKLSKTLDGAETARYKIAKELSEFECVFLLLSATPHQGDAGKFFNLMNLIDPIAFSTENDINRKKVKEYVVRNKKRAAIDNKQERLFKQRITTVYPIERAPFEDKIELYLYEEVTKYVTENYNLALGKNDRALSFLMILFQRLVSSSSLAIFFALKSRLERLKIIQDTLSLDEVNLTIEFDEQEAIDKDAEEILEELQNSAGIFTKEGVRKEIKILEHLLILARKASYGRYDSKVKGLINVIDEIIIREEDPNIKFLIFTEFIQTQKYLQDILTSCGYEVSILNGKMTTLEKMEAREKFRESAQFLISTDAGGEGINLQFCHVIINYDMPWNPMKLEQRIGRLDRIGQKFNVLVFNFMIRDSVEERVREIIESKLDLVKKQFGDDKMADILSTLQDDFNFDRLFIDAVIKREKEAKDLEEIAQEIYETAKQILEKDDLLLPQSTEDYVSFEEKIIEVSADRIKCLVKHYLQLQNKQLNEYVKQPNLYYFDIKDENGSTLNYRNVVFDHEIAIENDNLNFFHINHPFIKKILKEQAYYEGGTVTQLRVQTYETQLIQKKGIWAIYKLILTNNIDFYKQIPVSVFVDELGIHDDSLSKMLIDISPEKLIDFSLDFPLLNVEFIQRIIEEEVQKVSEDIYTEELIDWQVLLDKEREKFHNYFKVQEKNLEKIAISNIKEAKKREILINKEAKLKNINHRKNLVPKIELEQIAMIVFG